VGSFRLTLSLQDMIRHDCILPSVVESTSIPQETAFLWTPRFLFAVIHVSGKMTRSGKIALGKLIHWDPQRLKIVHTSIKKSFYLGTVKWCHEAYTVPVGNDAHIHSFSKPLNKLISLQEGSDLSTCQACEHTTGIHPQRGCCHLILKESYAIAMPKSCFHAMAYIYMWWWLQCE